MPGPSTLHLEPFAKRRTAVLGSLGQIGSRVLKELTKLSKPFEGVDWGSQGQEVSEWLNKTRTFEPTDLVIACGLTDSTCSREELFHSNFDFPKQVVEKFLDSDFRVLTLGSILERFPEVCAKNHYLASKLELSRWITQQSKAHPGRFIHVRLHTLYSSDVRSHMFLGQMLSALKSGSAFKMTTGEQLREYHHADDIAEMLLTILKSEWSSLGPVLELSSGKPIRLADLARTVFKACGKENLLELGALGKAAQDNWDTQFPRTKEILFKDRDPLSGVIEVVQKLL